MGIITCGSGKRTITRGRVRATNGPSRVRLITSHGRVGTSNGSLSFIAMEIISGRNGLYPSTRRLVGCSMGNTKACHTNTGKSPASLRLFRIPRVGIFGKVVATIIRDASGPKRVVLATANGKLGSNELILVDGWGSLFRFPLSIPHLVLLDKTCLLGGLRGG